METERTFTNNNKVFKNKYIYRPQLFKSTDLKKDAVYTIRGPMQVSKTTFIKLKIKDLLNKNTNPRNIFYYSMDLFKDEKEMFDIFVSWYQIFKKPSGRKYIFFDEVT